MLDWPVVIELAPEMGHTHAAAWVEADFGRYARAVFTGIRPDDEPEPTPPEPAPDPVQVAQVEIAREELGIETLEVRCRDGLDFHGVGVAGLKRALQRAFELGRVSR
jgi:hypothetical protein